MKVTLHTVPFTLIAVICCCVLVNSALSQEGYPHREKYPDIDIISTDNLKKQYDDVMIVDVRSNMEFDVVRIKKAVHVPISGRHFERDLKNQITKSDFRQPFKKWTFVLNSYF